ncbi:sugar transferase [Ruminococcus sp.]|uniref:sugar transferase n=1 Tax=Ruminococcus sp. TaxID=41978 RepID=UPI0025FA0ED0|nr:sugar transferase [uncultured Ruminococcus sp.]
MLKKWEDLPKFMQTKEVREYYDILAKKGFSLRVKRCFDVVVSLVMIIVLLPVLAIISLLIAADSKGGVLFCQERVTQYGRRFKIFKFRTMVKDADKLGSQVTVDNDMRITKVGGVLRKYRLDELPQLFNIFLGDMSFVGTRPEVPKYVEKYTPKMIATLLMPAGVTSTASIKYKDEAELLETADDVDMVYIKKVLPQKMKYNLYDIRKFSAAEDIFIMIDTVIAVLK